MNTSKKYYLWINILFFYMLSFPVLAQNANTQEAVAIELVKNFYEEIANQNFAIDKVISKYFDSEKVMVYNHIVKGGVENFTIREYLENVEKTKNNSHKKLSFSIKEQVTSYPKKNLRLLDVKTEVGFGMDRDSLGVLILFPNPESLKGKIYYIELSRVLAQENNDHTFLEGTINRCYFGIENLKNYPDSVLALKQKEIDDLVNTFSTDDFKFYIKQKGKKVSVLNGINRDLVTLQKKIDGYYKRKIFADKGSMLYFRKGTSNERKELFSKRFSYQNEILILEEGDLSYPIELDEESFSIPPNVKVGKYKFSLKFDDKGRKYFSSEVHIRHKYPLILKIGIAIPFAIWGIYDFYHHSTFQEPDLPMPPDPNDK